MELAQLISLDSEPKQFSKSNQVLVENAAAVNLSKYNNYYTCIIIIADAVCEKYRTSSKNSALLIIRHPLPND